MEIRRELGGQIILLTWIGCDSSNRQSSKCKTKSSAAAMRFLLTHLNILAIIQFAPLRTGQLFFFKKKPIIILLYKQIDFFFLKKQ